MAMKSIVISCKSITEEVDNYEQRKGAYMNAEDKSNLDSCKARLSATLKNLMSAAKNHATGYGISPVSLLDASAGHLTAAVVDLVKAVKLRRERGQNDNLSVDTYPYKIPSEPLPTNNFNSDIAPLKTKSSQNEMNNQTNGNKGIDIDELKVIYYDEVLNLNLSNSSILIFMSLILRISWNVKQKPLCKQFILSYRLFAAQHIVQVVILPAISTQLQQ